MQQNKFTGNAINECIQWCFLWFIILVTVFFNQGLWAAQEKEKQAPKTNIVKNTPTTLIDYLQQEKIFLTKAINQTKQYINPKNEKEFNSKTAQIAASLTIVDAKIESLSSFLENQKNQALDLNQKLKYLQQLPLNNTETNVHERVTRTEGLLTLNDQTLGLINENIEHAQQLKMELLDATKKLKTWQERFYLEQKLLVIKNQKAQLNSNLFALYHSNISEKHVKSPSTDGTVEQEAVFLINNQYLSLLHNSLDTLKIKKKVVKADILLLDSPDTKTMQTVVDIYKEAINQTKNIESSLQQLHHAISKESALIASLPVKKKLTALNKDLILQLEAIKIQKAELLNNFEHYQTQLKNIISTRQSLSQYKINSWPIILGKIVAIPGQLYKYIKTLSLKVYDSYGWFELIPSIIFWLLLSATVLFYAVLSHFLKSLLGYKERSKLAGYLYDGVVVIFQRNMPYLCLLSMLGIVLYFTSISYANCQLLLSLIVVWFTFRVLILIARIALLERLSDVSGQDVKLYYRLKWLFLFGGWTTALMVIGQLLPLAIIIQDIFNRLFMLFILTFSLVAWKSKDVIPSLLGPFLSGKKRYVRNATFLLIILLPITLFTTAIIGLSGYISLAWTLSGYEAYGLLMMVAYVLMRGLIADVLELISEWMISSLENGWLWIEVFLKPLDKILRAVLLLSIISILFQVFGWHADSLVMINLSKIAHYTLINFTGIYITVTSVIEFLIVLAVFVWAAKWTREFCYRWLYKNAKDVAIRNSLSIFTQYAVILLGGFITLHVLGLDLSGMSMILGGLAVGMGFGLRDFASNIIGGIMLLIERPVREGDLITLGEHEGRVAHIGIRTMRVSSWDNMEVLIPNAETFNKPFTNWTLQDSIVRTVIPIKVCRSDDPVIVQQILLDVLAIIPEIVPDPPTQVFLKKIDEALIEFEIRYFINVQINSRVEVRSKVLFAITAHFKSAGIRPPIEPVAIEINEKQFNDLQSTKKLPAKD